MMFLNIGIIRSVMLVAVPCSVYKAERMIKHKVSYVQSKWNIDVTKLC